MLKIVTFPFCSLKKKNVYLFKFHLNEDGAFEDGKRGAMTSIVLPDSEQKVLKTIRDSHTRKNEISERRNFFNNLSLK